MGALANSVADGILDGQDMFEDIRSIGGIVTVAFDKASN
jgi:hypothetical protein